jgi:S-(hydroxymethyl)glutathione dehydrogenase / alcohol dehydrogenase
MKTRAAVAWEAKKPLTIETIEIGGPKPGEVLCFYGQGRH